MVPEESHQRARREAVEHDVKLQIVFPESDDRPAETGDERDAIIYSVGFDDGHVADVRWRDLRSPIEE